MYGYEQMYEYEQWYERIAALVHVIRLRTLERVREDAFEATADDSVEYLLGRVEIMATVLEREDKAERVFRSYQLRAFPIGAATLALAQETLTAL